MNGCSKVEMIITANDGWNSCPFNPASRWKMRFSINPDCPIELPVLIGLSHPPETFAYFHARSGLLRRFLTLADSYDADFVANSACEWGFSLDGCDNPISTELPSIVGARPACDCSFDSRAGLAPTRNFPANGFFWINHSR